MQLFIILIQKISAKLNVKVPVECSLGARINTVEAVDRLTCETSLSTSTVTDEHCEGQKCLGPTAVISSPSENYYSYYAKTVPFTEVGNGTFNVLNDHSADGNKVSIQHLNFIAVDEYMPTILVEMFISDQTVIQGENLQNCIAIIANAINNKIIGVQKHCDKGKVK